ncbi:hypothetical protein JCM8202_002307 [Rhodotorula sphaerocarpa]
MAPPRSAAAQKLRQQQQQQQGDADLLPSDEDDSDFQLSGPETRGGGSSSSSSSSSESDTDATGTNAKKKRKVKSKKRTREQEPQATEEPAKPAVDVDDLWAQFNAADDDPYTAKSAPTAPAESGGSADAKGKGKAVAGPDQTRSNGQDDDLVTIEIEYEFAGEKVKQQKRVARSSAEAQAYFGRNSTAAAPGQLSSDPKSAAPAKDPTAAALDALFGPEDPSSTTAAVPSPAAPSTAAAPITSSAPVPPPAAKRRKTGGAGGSLSGMAASLGVAGAGGKPAKLNTLEKSKLDWSSYVSSETGLEDTLAHARKDGYLDRRDFLDRVDASKEEQWDQARRGGRRR